MKLQINSQQFNPFIGLNELPQHDPMTGKLSLQMLANDVALMLNNPKNPVNRSNEEIQRKAQINMQYTPLKKIKDFDRQLIIPSEFYQKQYIMFYSRFESGNLYRVVKRPPKEQVTFSGLTISEVEKARRQQMDTEYFDFEYDLYLQFDTNSVEGLMHWYYF